MKLLTLNLILTALLVVSLISSRTIDYRTESVRAIITAYSKAETCPNEVCITASGKVATTGMIACPREVKFGTKVKIGEKVYVCEDRTALRYNGRYDIWHESYEDALEFGIKSVEVIVLNNL